ncbi:MAG TPA: hypothetical protein VHU42_11260, partial [Rhodopila sp.]|nr:hypothetical protein [Rhodopila sp.]
RGNKDAALAMLGTLGTARADAARAEIYAGRKDWPKAVSALTAWEQKAVSGANLTDHQQAMLMRLVVAAALSSDAPTLQRVAATYGATMAKSHSAALFRVLTSPPVQQEADLPRAFEDIQQTRQLLDNLHETESP